MGKMPSCGCFGPAAGGVISIVRLAQLVRAFGSHPKGHWFESSNGHSDTLLPEVSGSRVPVFDAVNFSCRELLFLFPLFPPGIVSARHCLLLTMWLFTYDCFRRGRGGDFFLSTASLNVSSRRSTSTWAISIRTRSPSRYIRPFFETSAM